MTSTFTIYCDLDPCLSLTKVFFLQIYFCGYQRNVDLNSENEKHRIMRRFQFFEILLKTALFSGFKLGTLIVWNFYFKHFPKSFCGDWF